MIKRRTWKIVNIMLIMFEKDGKTMIIDQQTIFIHVKKKSSTAMVDAQLLKATMNHDQNIQTGEKELYKPSGYKRPPKPLFSFSFHQPESSSLLFFFCSSQKEN